MIDGRRPPATIDTGVSGRGWSRHAHAAILSDAGMLADAAVAQEVGVGPHQVAELVARGRLEMVDHEHRCAVASPAQLLRRDGAAIDHAMGCELCSATRAALREGRRQLREAFAAPARRPVARRGVRAERMRATTRSTTAHRPPPPAPASTQVEASMTPTRATSATEGVLAAAEAPVPMDPAPGSATDRLAVTIGDLTVDLAPPGTVHVDPTPAPTASVVPREVGAPPVEDPRGRRARTVGMLGVLVLAMGTMTSPSPDAKVPLPTAMSHRPTPAVATLSVDDPVWDELAGCESSGRWDLDTGNGFHGGLQFTRSSWEMVGGQGLPHEASREEQVRRAVALHEVQGWGAWPGCAEELGLSEG